MLRLIYFQMNYTINYSVAGGGSHLSNNMSVGNQGQRTIVLNPQAQNCQSNPNLNTNSTQAAVPIVMQVGLIKQSCVLYIPAK